MTSLRADAPSFVPNNNEHDVSSSTTRVTNHHQAKKRGQERQERSSSVVVVKNNNNDHRRHHRRRRRSKASSGRPTPTASACNDHAETNNNRTRDNETHMSDGSRRRKKKNEITRRHGQSNEHSLAKKTKASDGHDRRRNARQKKQKEGNSRNDNEEDVSQDYTNNNFFVEDDETAFPLLAERSSDPSSNKQKQMDEMSTAWSSADGRPAVRLMGKEQASTSSFAKEEEPTDGDLESSAILAGLTMLRKGNNGDRATRPTTERCNNQDLSSLSPAQAQQVSGEIQHGNGRSELPQSGTMKQQKFDMTKLRNRWWQVIKNRPPPEPAPEPDNEEEDDEWSASDDSSDDFYVPSRAAVEEKHDVRIDDVYYSSSLPLHDAIRKNDEGALRVILKSENFQNKSSATGSDLSPIQLAVRLDRPRLLRILTDKKNGLPHHYNQAQQNDKYPPPIIMAVELGYEECLQVFISISPASLLSRDAHGNTVLHTCCNEHAPASLLKLCLRTAGGSFVTKLLFQTNTLGQTPLHIACQNGRVDLIEIILSIGSLSLLSKALSAQDANHQTPLLTAVAYGSTDVVMSLLMWRGNNHVGVHGSGKFCPLVWAIRSNNVDMLMLLLEFNDPSGKGYDLTGALYVTVRLSGSLNDVLLTMVRVLVEAGANPCSVDTPRERSCVSLATELHKPSVVSALLSSYAVYLDSVRTARRRDPMLQRQPESFFSNLESNEDAERTASMRDALACSLFLGWKGFSHKDLFDYCSLTLYRHGASLGRPGLHRLKQSFRCSTIKQMADVTMPESEHYLYETYFQHPLCMADASKSKDEKVRLGYWSYVMQNSPWKIAGDGCTCDWISSLLTAKSDFFASKEVPECDVTLVSDDGHHFTAHQAIISEKSEKLAAAIRFALMKKDADDVDVPEISVSSSGRYCRWMLQHLYHGSIMDLPYDPAECCGCILEIMVLAEEYLAYSLVQECEMRLISSEPRRCHCCLCSHTDSAFDTKHEYYVCGPSKCITPEAATDILAVSQFVGESFNANSYRIARNQSSSLPSWLMKSSDCVTSKKQDYVKPLHSLREAAVSNILLNFQAVIETSSFESHFRAEDESDLGPEHEKSRLLLNSCMDELASACVAST